MQANTPNKEEKETINARVAEYMNYLAHNPYAAIKAELYGEPVILIAAEKKGVENGIEGVFLHPLFLIPSPELILNVLDPETKEPIFGLAITQ